ncbi:tyrosine-type recombinase/integrase [Hyphobacterium sp.]|uniref:tyrosine-type recombinase/integrase n=1 Tax=Hyphobacterium sp. TaxID=2004662 RepID=UPI003BAB75DF
MLTESKIRSLSVPTEKDFIKYSDRDGLVVVVYRSGRKTFKWNYRRNGRQYSITIGQYPAISLAEARQIVAGLRIALQRGVDPRTVSAGHKVQSAGKTLAEYIDDEIELAKQDGMSANTIKKRQWLKDEFDQALLAEPIKNIEPKQFVAQIKKFIAKGHRDKARRAAGLLKRSCRIAVLEGEVPTNAAAELGLILPKAEHVHHPAIIDHAALPDLLASVARRSGSESISMALTVQPHAFLRPSELRKGRWDEVDFANAEWVIPAARMKMKRDHVVPLSVSVYALLETHRAKTDSEWMFPAWSDPDRPISENGMNQALWRLGYKGVMTAHGFRSTASTLLNEMNWNWDWIEIQLSHEPNNSVRGAYNRARYLDGRRSMMNRWSAFIDQLTDYGLGKSTTLPNPMDFGPVGNRG